MVVVVLGVVGSGGGPPAPGGGGLEGVRGDARGCLRAPRGGRAPPARAVGAGGGGDTRRRAPRSMAGPWWCCCSGWPSRRTSGSRERPLECLYRAAMAATLDVGC